jgi:transposase
MLFRRVCAEELYQAVENLCTYKMAETVYQRLKALIENHVAEVVKQFLGKRSQRHRFDSLDYVPYPS